MRSIIMPPSERSIEAPNGGWQKGVYLVDVAFNKNNPIHGAILCTPFVRGGQPFNETLFCHCWEENHQIRDMHYLKVISYSKTLTRHLA